MQRGHPKPNPIDAGQESVWDYPRPPRLEPVPERLRVIFDGLTIADTLRGWRVLETSHPPTYYLHPDDIQSGALVPAGGGSVCEWKGRALYFDVVGPHKRAERVAWAYPNPTKAFAPLAGHVAFYAGPMDGCFVGDERVTPQPGGFYGGWITKRIVGPFKGEPGTMGW
ncbi:DUF427 domain-containing protein [Methylobacterium sp. SyP6R]|uniref:DUF427 domain-containing protein n=1 Tax=Methylobacterium sp. SyP6R TaxID=2718876 RepID=UPI001F398F94|nr:DUF427 domain-containing protein [Methylobacterium sp. SyP6R]MCF4126408.1 DUF427 domain-containing protein [Methylobacterium sp. SyP6R]